MILQLITDFLVLNKLENICTDNEISKMSHPIMKKL